MYNSATTFQFHKAMKGILDECDIAIEFGITENEDYYKMIRGKTQKQIFEFFLPKVQGPSYEEEYREHQRKEYLQAIADINYDLALSVAEVADYELMVEGVGRVKVPFYFGELLGLQGEMSGDKLVFSGNIETVGEQRGDAYYQTTRETKFYATLKGRMVESYDKVYEKISDDAELTEFFVSYEYYSSYYIDPGKTVSVWAKSVDDAVEVAKERVDSPEDGLYHSFTVDGEEYGSGSRSYLEVIEEPGIAKAEAAERKRLKEEEEKKKAKSASGMKK